VCLTKTTLKAKISLPVPSTFNIQQHKDETTILAQPAMQQRASPARKLTHAGKCKYKNHVSKEEN